MDSEGWICCLFYLFARGSLALWVQRKISAGRINEDILTKKQHIDLILCHTKTIFSVSFPNIKYMQLRILPSWILPYLLSFVRSSQAWHPTFSPLYDLLDRTNQIFSDSSWHPLLIHWSTDYWPITYPDPPDPPNPPKTHWTWYFLHFMTSYYSNHIFSDSSWHPPSKYWPTNQWPITHPDPPDQLNLVHSCTLSLCHWVLFNQKDDAVQ